MKALLAAVTDPNSNVLLKGPLRADCVIARKWLGGVGVGGDQDTPTGLCKRVPMKEELVDGCVIVK
jgi:hypothetical protein